MSFVTLILTELDELGPASEKALKTSLRDRGSVMDLLNVARGDDLSGPSEMTAGVGAGVVGDGGRWSCTAFTGAGCSGIGDGGRAGVIPLTASVACHDAR